MSHTVVEDLEHTLAGIVEAVPTEIVLQIFEQAAIQDQSTACALTLLSKGYREKIEPLLYETVKLPTEESLRRFNETMARLKSADFLAKYVKAVHIKSVSASNDSEFFDTQLLSTKCTGLTQLALPHDGLDYHQVYTNLRPPRLTHLTVHGLLGASMFNFTMPLWATVTHLHFPFDIPRHLSINEGKMRTTLTHFSCCYNRSIVVTQHKILPGVLDMLLKPPSSLLVVVVHVYTGDKLLTLHEMNAMLDDMFPDAEEWDPRKDPRRTRTRRPSGMQNLGWRSRSMGVGTGASKIC